jgi:Flp pilus assembly protein TadB
MKDDDSTRLTEQERRVLAEMEMALQRDAPELDHDFRRRGWRPRLPRRGREARLVWWVLVVLGAALLTAGLLVGAVPVSAAGFVVLLVAVHELSFVVRPGSPWRRVRGWFTHDEGTPGPPDG